jgi:hypothetical protein
MAEVVEFPDNEFLTETGFNTTADRGRINIKEWDLDARSGENEHRLYNHIIAVIYQLLWEEDDCKKNQGRQQHRCMRHKCGQAVVDLDAWRWFFDYLDNWKVEDFGRLNRETRTKLKNFLQYRGVYVEHGRRRRLPTAFAELFAPGDSGPWPPYIWPEEVAANEVFHPESVMASKSTKQAVGPRCQRQGSPRRP